MNLEINLEMNLEMNLEKLIISDIKNKIITSAINDNQSFELNINNYYQHYRAHGVNKNIFINCLEKCLIKLNSSIKSNENKNIYVCIQTNPTK